MGKRVKESKNLYHYKEIRPGYAKTYKRNPIKSIEAKKENQGEQKK